MHCLRCGRETENQHVFCKACLEYMSLHPVKSDTPIYLPIRKEKDVPRKQYRWHRRERTTEEMVVILRKRVRFFAAVSLILFMMLSAAVAGVWLAKKQGAQIPIPNIGQNFLSSSSSTTDTTEG